MNDRTSIARRLMALASSTLADVRAGAGVVAGLQRFAGKGTVAGPAATAACADGSLQAMFAAMEAAQPGDVLCAAAPGHTAYMGDLMAQECLRRGIVGAVVEGHVRDVDTVSPLPLSVHARGLNPAARRGGEGGSAMVPITLGTVVVSPGDWIVGDGDGVIVIPAQLIDEVLPAAEAAAQVEQRILARVKAGERLTDAVRAERGR